MSEVRQPPSISDLATQPFRRVPAVSKLLGIASAWLGDTDRAFEWLTKAFDARFLNVGWANVSPLYDVFRGDSRFDALIARLRLPR